MSGLKYKVMSRASANAVTTFLNIDLKQGKYAESVCCGMKIFIKNHSLMLGFIQNLDCRPESKLYKIFFNKFIT